MTAYSRIRAEAEVHNLRMAAASKVAEELHRRGWTQAEAARHLGVTQPRISNLVRGQIHKFTLDTLLEWAVALDVPLSLQLGSAADHNQEIVNYTTRVLELQPSDFGAYMRRGNAYLRLRDYPAAIADFSRCIELDPSRSGGWNNRALAYRLSGQLRAALLDADTLVERFPDDDCGYYQRADVLARLERYDEALADYARAVELEPNRPGAYSNRALLYKHLGRIEEARADYRRALELHPADAFLQQALDALA